MPDLLILLVHQIEPLVRLMGPGGARSGLRACSRSRGQRPHRRSASVSGRLTVRKRSTSSGSWFMRVVL